VIVVDTNLIGYLLLASERTAQAEQALYRDSEWAAPLLWRSELRNVLAVQMRSRRMSLQHAQAVITEAEELMRGREYTVISLDVLRLAGESGCSAYDCEFVVLALDLGVPLVTVDRQVLAAFPQTAISLDIFSRV
jgi:predicted nucleic acid-binding protein